MITLTNVAQTNTGGPLMPRNNSSFADQSHLAQAQVALGHLPTSVRIDDSTFWQTTDLGQPWVITEVVRRVHRAVHGRTSTHAGRA